jgi:parallel beta-helix repeat protein
MIQDPAKEPTAQSPGNEPKARSPADEAFCDRYAAVDGADEAKGTESEPFLNVQKLLDSLGPGETGCLRAGTYDVPEGVQIANGGTVGRRVVLRSAPNERATIKGRIWVKEGADYVTVRDLYLNGANSLGRLEPPEGLPSPTVNGDHTEWINNDITNHHTGICFDLGSAKWGIATGTVLEQNRIHDCGQLPPTNHHHGIYVHAARATKIIGNLIYDNADRGIQLYPDAQGTLIRGNIIDGNGEGIIFSGRGAVASSHTIVERNVIANSKERWNVESSWDQTTKIGQRNFVHDNCVWATNSDDYYNQNGGINPKEVGFDAANNLVAHPMYVNRRVKDFELLGSSPCRAILGDRALPER